MRSFGLRMVPPIRNTWLAAEARDGVFRRRMDILGLVVSSGIVPTGEPPRPPLKTPEYIILSMKLVESRGKYYILQCHYNWRMSGKTADNNDANGHGSASIDPETAGWIEELLEKFPVQFSGKAHIVKVAVHDLRTKLLGVDNGKKGKA